MRRPLLLGVLAATLVSHAGAHGGHATTRVDDAAVRRAMEDELARSMKDLRLGNEPRPYFLAYAITDLLAAQASATFGAPVGIARVRFRSLRTDVRVGDPSFDNSNSEGGFGRAEQLPTEDDYAALRREIWQATDTQYKAAVEALARKRAAAQGQAKGEEDAVPDFSSEKPTTTVVPAAGPAAATPDPEALREVVTRLSAVFRDFPQIHASRVDAGWTVSRRRLLSSEGTWADESQATVRLAVIAETQAGDGMPLRDFVTFAASEPEALLAVGDLEKATRRMAAELTALRTAPLAENGSATVLFDGPAAPQLVRGLLADQLPGTPPPRTAGLEGAADRTEWSSKIGQKVAAATLSIVDDPTAAAGGTGGKTPLWGAYRADDEGVPARKVTLVEKGRLRALLMTRTPSKEIGHSNGHARATAFGPPTARPGNLIVRAEGGLGRAALLKKLESTARAGGNTAYVVSLIDDGSVTPIAMDDAFGGFRFNSGRGGPAAVRPLRAARVRDGKLELVRGLTLEGLQPRSFKDVVAAGRDATVLSLHEPPAGAIGIPTSIVAPPLVVDDVDVKKSTGKNRRPPLYGHPFFAAKPR